MNTRCIAIVYPKITCYLFFACLFLTFSDLVLVFVNFDPKIYKPFVSPHPYTQQLLAVSISSVMSPPLPGRHTGCNLSENSRGSTSSTKAISWTCRYIVETWPETASRTGVATFRWKSSCYKKWIPLCYYPLLVVKFIYLIKQNSITHVFAKTAVL